MSADEPVEEIGPDGSPLRIVTRARMRAGRLRHRGVFVAVVTSDRRLVVHRRSDQKDLWPSRWDIAAGGVVGAGERWDSAAARELAEELGIDGVTLERLGGGSFDDDDVHLLGEVFLARTDGPFHFTDGEVVEVRRVDRAGLAELRASQPFCPDSIELVLPRIVDLLA